MSHLIGTGGQEWFPRGDAELGIEGWVGVYQPKEVSEEYSRQREEYMQNPGGGMSACQRLFLELLRMPLLLPGPAQAPEAWKPTVDILCSKIMEKLFLPGGPLSPCGDMHHSHQQGALTRSYG